MLAGWLAGWYVSVAMSVRCLVSISTYFGATGYAIDMRNPWATILFICYVCVCVCGRELVNSIGTIVAPTLTSNLFGYSIILRVCLLWSVCASNTTIYGVCTVRPLGRQNLWIALIWPTRPFIQLICKGLKVINEILNTSIRSNPEELYWINAPTFDSGSKSWLGLIQLTTIHRTKILVLYSLFFFYSFIDQLR